MVTAEADAALHAARKAEAHIQRVRRANALAFERSHEAERRTLEREALAARAKLHVEEKKMRKEAAHEASRLKLRAAKLIRSERLLSPNGEECAGILTVEEEPKEHEQYDHRDASSVMDVNVRGLWSPAALAGSDDEVAVQQETAPVEVHVGKKATKSEKRQIRRLKKAAREAEVRALEDMRSSAELTRAELTRAEFTRDALDEADQLALERAIELSRQETMCEKPCANTSTLSVHAPVFKPGVTWCLEVSFTRWPLLSPVSHERKSGHLGPRFPAAWGCGKVRGESRGQMGQ